MCGRRNLQKIVFNAVTFCNVYFLLLTSTRHFCCLLPEIFGWLIMPVLIAKMAPNLLRVLFGKHRWTMGRMRASGGIFCEFGVFHLAACGSGRRVGIVGSRAHEPGP